MQIKNQFKNTIVNYDKVRHIRIESNENQFDIVVKYAKDDEESIGTYESYLRTQEILDEITMEYKKVARVDTQGNRQPRFYSIPKVYCMPEK